MHDLLLGHKGPLRLRDLTAYAERLGLEVKRFEDDLRRHSGAGQIAEDVDSADLSGVSGTPTFFINERRHQGAYDVATLAAAVRAARARAAIAP
jgi:predicted DsbA family dithiol-disulfide isomerase